ncbi:helix-turn-helix domain-containing protein [Kitasatospora purpeofusca]|uniref:helix-turn-helix domain-containing protein n=1 Tax=Kitasatospora purpeofusca TaxID=67352 RepID=UPI00386C90BE|nr:helix-turn-helix domain-containing protein [Kitasatospora purpeofusca]
MPQRPKALEPSRSARAWFGAELRHWRETRRLSQDALGALVHVSGDLISKIEKGQRPCKVDLAAALDAALGTGGVLSRGLEHVDRDADKKPSDVDKLDVSTRGSRATKPATLSPPVVAADERRPIGPEVDAAALGSAMTLMSGEVRVACRTSDGRISFVTMPRRKLLRSVTAVAGATLLPAPGASSNVPPTKPWSAGLLASDMHPVENFRALRRSLVECDNFLGPRNVVAEGQDHIRQIQKLRQETSGRDRQDLMQVQAEYAEFCSWLYQDSGDFRAAQYWADRAIEWSTVAGAHDLTIYTMARKAQLAGDMRDPLDTVDLAEAAQRIAPPRSRLSAMGAVFGAHGHALRGDERASRSAFDQAFEVVAGPDVDETFRGRWLDASYVEAQRARSLSALGNHQDAVSGFESAIRALPASYRRDRGVYLARAAVAQLHANGPEPAAVSGSAALAIAAATGSARIFTELAVLDAKMQRWAAVTEVAEFREALDNVMLHEV